LDICNCARANCDARANGVKVYLGALGHFACNQGEGAGVAAVDRRKLVAGDKAIGFRARDGGIALDVGNDQVEFGAAERLDAAAVVDHVNGELGGGDAANPDLRHAAGGRIKRADIDGLGSPAAQWHRAERTGGE
jgi:hypothetical protein